MKRYKTEVNYTQFWYSTKISNVFKHCKATQIHILVTENTVDLLSNSHLQISIHTAWQR